MPSSTLQTISKQVQKIKLEKEVLEEQLINTTEELESAQIKANDIAQAQTILQTIASQTQSMVEEKLSRLVTAALHTVFPESPYDFLIKFEKKRNSTECKLLYKKGDEEFNPLFESGGGTIDIASIALLISFIMIEKKHPVIFLDEAMKHMSKERAKVAAQFLKSVCEKLILQIIMVTHIQELIEYAHKSFEVINGEVHESD